MADTGTGWKPVLLCRNNRAIHVIVLTYFAPVHTFLQVFFK